MGFCLFEHADRVGMYFAINAAHVLEIKSTEKDSEGRPVSLINCDFPPNGIEAFAVGSKDDINAILLETAKLGVNKAEIHILAGQKNVKPQPLVFNYADQVVLITELIGDAIPHSEQGIVTASQLFMNDGTIKRIVERPGVFAGQINAGGRVPILNVDIGADTE